MVSLGGCVGYLLPALDWSRGLLSVYLGGQAECLFSLLILIFISSVLITMKISEEPSCASSGLAGSGSLLESGAGAMEAGRCGVPRSCCYLIKCKLRLLKSGPLLCLLRTCWSMTPAIYRSYCHVPRVMKQLCVAQLCSWMAVMSFMLFYTDFVGEGLYEGVPSALPGSVSRQRYDEGQISSCSILKIYVLCELISFVFKRCLPKCVSSSLWYTDRYWEMAVSLISPQMSILFQHCLQYDITKKNLYNLVAYYETNLHCVSGT